jgi:hypothetical protein
VRIHRTLDQQKTARLSATGPPVPRSFFSSQLASAKTLNFFPVVIGIQTTQITFDLGLVSSKKPISYSISVVMPDPDDLCQEPRMTLILVEPAKEVKLFARFPSQAVD